LIRATISREPAHRSWSADPAGALSPSVAVALSTFPTNAMSPAIRFFSVNGLLSEDKLVWAAGNFRDQQQRVRPRLEAMEAGGFWPTPSRSRLLTVEPDLFVEELQRRCSIRACCGAVPTDPEHARIVGIASPVGGEGDVARAQISRLFRKLAERHRPAVRCRRDDSLRCNAFCYPIMQRLQRIEAVRRNSATGTA